MTAMLSCLAPSPISRLTLAAAATGGGGAKHAHRLLSTLNTTPSTDPTAANRLIRKFISSSPKSTALQTLSHTLSQSSPFAFPIYQSITLTPWFKWNPKLAAAVVALLEKQSRPGDAKILFAQSTAALDSPRDVAYFYCELIDAFSEQGLKNPVLDFHQRLLQIQFSSRRTYECVVKAMSLVGMPDHAEAAMEEMTAAGFKPSAFEFRSVLQGYGRLGLFSDMMRVVEIMVDAGLGVDTVCANVVLSCYGDHGQLGKMVSWLGRMRGLGIGFSVRTLNTVLNSCPMLVSMMHDLRSLPVSIEALVEKLEEDEGMLVKEMIASPVLFDTVEWSASEGKLDFHGFHSTSAYVTLLHWMENLRLRFRDGGFVPLEISVVCGLGKHSSKRGESPIKLMVSALMFELKSPMRIDRKNAGRFIAKGKVMRDWLC